MMDMKDAVDKMLLYILREIGNQTGALYFPPVKLTTGDGCVVYINDEVGLSDSVFAGLVDAYNYIVWGKALHQ